MQWFTPPPIQIALSQCGTGRRLAAVQLRQGKVRVLKCWTASQGQLGLPGGAQFEDAVLSYGLAASETLLRPVELKLSKASDIEAVLPFETEPLLPFPIEEAAFDAVITNQAQNRTQLKVIVARKAALIQRINGLREQGFEPEVVSAAPLGLAALNLFLTEDPNPHLLIHIGETETDCVWVQGARVLASMSLANGLQSLNEQARTVPVAENQSPEVQRWWGQLRQLLHRSVVPLNKTHQPKLLLLGPGSLIPSLQSDLANLLSLEPLSPAATNFEGVELADVLLYALPIGLAVSAQTSSFNFRKGDLAYPHPWRRFKPLLVKAWALGFLLASVLYVTGQYYIQQRSRTLYQDYLDRAAIVLADTEASVPEDLDELSMRITELEEQLETGTEPFPLQAQVPKVEDLLAWLASHPQLHPQDGSVQLDKLHYSMVKRPQKGHTRDRYQVKVELELLSEVPRHARAFHDSLTEEKKLIDQKQAITWTNTAKGGFRASFFLKDRTRYFGRS